MRANGPPPVSTAMLAGVPMDLNNDGHADSIGYDTTGDGKVDSTLAGVLIDLNNDGHADGIGFDTTGDGKVDCISICNDIPTHAPLQRRSSKETWAMARPQMLDPLWLLLCIAFFLLFLLNLHPPTPAIPVKRWLLARRVLPPAPVPLLSEDSLLLAMFAVGVLLIIRLTPPAEPGNLSARRVYSLSTALLAASTLALTAFEPGISAIDSFYLACMTFLTIGYGDVEHPASSAGRILVSLLALGGVAFFAVTLEMVHSMRKHRADGVALGTLLGESLLKEARSTKLKRHATLGKLSKLALDIQEPTKYPASHSWLTVRGDHVLAAGMLAVNFALGVVLCNFLTDDQEMPKGVLDALYWSVITSTSVGFGDFHPTTALGKVCVCAYAFCTMTATANAMDVAKEKFVELCTTPSDLEKRD